MHKILERRTSTIIGKLCVEKDRAFLIPYDRKVRQNIDLDVRTNRLNRHHNGMIAEITITRWPSEGRNPEGRVVEILGSEDDPGLDVEIVIRSLNLPAEFPRKFWKRPKSLVDRSVRKSGTVAET